MLSDPESQFSKPNWSDSKALNPIPRAVAVLLGGGVIIHGNKKALSRFWVNSIDGALYDFMHKYWFQEATPKSLSLDCHLAFTFRH